MKIIAQLSDRAIQKGIVLCVFIIAGLNVAGQTINIDSLRNTLPGKVADSGAIPTYLRLSNAFIDIYNYDSALLYLNKADELIKKFRITKYDFNINVSFSKLFSQGGNYSLARQYQLKLLNILDVQSQGKYDTLEIGKKYARLYTDFAYSYFYMENPDKSLEYYKKAYNIITSLKQQYPGHYFDDELLVLKSNIGSAYLGLRNFDEALKYFKQAIEMNKVIQNQNYNAVLFNNMGIIYKEKDSCSRAFPYYEEALAIRNQLRDTSGMAQVLNNMGSCLQKNGNYTQAISYFMRAMDYSRKSKNLNSEMLAANALTDVYEALNNYGQALEMHRLYKQLHDSIINIEEIQKTASLELQYKFEKQIKEQELEQQLLLAQKERKSWIYLAIAVVLLFSFIIVIMFNRNQRIKIREAGLVRQHLELEKQNLLLERKNLKLDLELKNKELATHVMYLVNKNEFIASITEKLLSIRPLLLPENKGWVQEIIREMKSNIDNTVWDEFEVRFQQVHEDFYQKLSEAYPDLTPNETKLCAF